MEWQIVDAKSQLSNLLNKAETEGPQFITRHGRPAGVVLSPEEYQRLTKASSFKSLLLSAPLEELPLERKQSAARDIQW